MNEKNVATIAPFISIVLATKGVKTDLLEKCIVSLNNQIFRDFEIILVYSVYPQKISQLIAENNIITIKENGKTLSAARNLGVEHAQSKIIAFIDDDAEAPNDWLNNIHSVFLQYPETVGLGGPNITPALESQKSPMMFVAGEFGQALTGETVRLGQSTVGKIAGCNVAYRKDIFQKIGCLNEKLRSGEDWDLNIRLCENGYVIRFDPEVKVWHHRQGLKHAFLNSSNMVSFFLSWKALKYSRHESLFASFYLSNALFWFLLITLFVSPLWFIIISCLFLIGNFSLAAIRSKTFDRRLLYYPLVISFTLARIIGFYYGIFKQLKYSLRRKKNRIQT